MSMISAEQWEARLGAQVRALRIASLIDQAELAERANISTKTLGALERGEGTSVKTLIKVVRVLDRSDWLDDLDPERLAKAAA